MRSTRRTRTNPAAEAAAAGAVQGAAHRSAEARACSAGRGVGDHGGPGQEDVGRQRAWGRDVLEDLHRLARHGRQRGKVCKILSAHFVVVVDLLLESKRLAVPVLVRPGQASAQLLATPGCAG